MKVAPSISRMAHCLSLLVLAYWCSPATAQTQSDLRSYSAASPDARLVELHRLVSATECAEGPLLTQAKAFMAASKNSKIARFMIFTSRRDASVARYGKGADYGYAVWLSYYREAVTNIGCIGEVVRMGVCEAMRIRDRSQQIVERVLSHCSPFLVPNGDAKARILYLRLDARKGSNILVPHVYVRAKSPVTERLAATYASSIAERLQLSELKVSLRADNWFAFDENFPVVYPFGAIEEAPPEEYFRRNPTVHHRYSTLATAPAQPRCDVPVAAKEYSACLPLGWSGSMGKGDRINACNGPAPCTGDGGGFPLPGRMLAHIIPAATLGWNPTNRNLTAFLTAHAKGNCATPQLPQILRESTLPEREVQIRTCPYPGGQPRTLTYGLGLSGQLFLIRFEYAPDQNDSRHEDVLAAQAAEIVASIRLSHVAAR